MPQGESSLSLAKVYNKFNYPKRSSSPPSSPYNSSQAPADEHRLTQRSNNRLHTKIAPLKRTYKKPLPRGAKTNQYWSDQRPVLVDFLLPHRIPRVQLIPMQLFALELW